MTFFTPLVPLPPCDRTLTYSGKTYVPAHISWRPWGNGCMSNNAACPVGLFHEWMSNGVEYLSGGFREWMSNSVAFLRRVWCPAV
jgi:hypothetical protein